MINIIVGVLMIAFVMFSFGVFISVLNNDEVIADGY